MPGSRHRHEQGQLAGEGLEKSTSVGVTPPISTCRPLPASPLVRPGCGVGRGAGGIGILRGGAGVEQGDHGGAGGLTWEGSGYDSWLWEAASTPAKRSSSAGPWSAETSSNGPLNPGPKPLASRS